MEEIASFGQRIESSESRGKAPYVLIVRIAQRDPRGGDTAPGARCGARFGSWGRGLVWSWHGPEWVRPVPYLS